MPIFFMNFIRKEHSMRTYYSRLVIFLLTASAALLLQSCGGDRETIGIVRETLESILRGDKPPEDVFAWESLVISGENIGATYSKMGRAFEKQEYRNYTFTKIATAFKANGWTRENMKDWRVYQSTKRTATVAIDVPNGTIIVVLVLIDGQKKITSIGKLQTN